MVELMTDQFAQAGEKCNAPSDVLGQREQCRPMEYFCHGGLRHGLRRFGNLVELSYCKLKNIYMLCENFIYTGQGHVLGLAGLVSRWAGLRLVGFTEFWLAGLVSCWARLVPPGSASAPLTERASRWVSMSSVESALSRLSGLSFMTILL